jgi:hypothetical protein
MICIATIFKNFKYKNSTFSDQTITKSFGYLVEESIKSFNGMAFRNGGRSLINWLLAAVGDVGGKVSKFRVSIIAVFAFRVAKIYKNEGVRGVVMTLKTSHILLMQSLAGYRIENQNPLKRRVRRDRTGLPLWIPKRSRDILRTRNNGIVRLWTSLLALYRVLDMPGKLNLNSITDMGPKLDRLSSEDKRMLNMTINRFWDHFDLPSLKSKFRSLDFTFFPIGKSSPQTSNSLFSSSEASWSSKIISTTPFIIWSASRVWLAKKNEWFHEHLTIYLESVNSEKKQWFLNTLWSLGTFDYTKVIPKHVVAKYKYDYLQSIKDGNEASRFLGKLGFKKEPAGKIRVFAMVDCWTQWLFWPLHKFIQDILRTLSMDATFDQVGKLEKKLAEMQKKYKKPKAFSYDLSSATDRLPVLLQVYILAPLLGLKSAIAWANVLITRKYYIADETADAYNIENNKPLAYAVGQPMGALSSWVMLALTHHIIVQWAFISAKDRKLGRWIFKDYIVLGDDVVIFDPVVAARYYHIMTKLLGVEIGLAKSIVSKGTWSLEFAKKYYLDGMKANMLPLRDVIVSKIATGMLSEFQEKHSLTFQHYLKVRGLGYRARSKWTADFWNMSQRLRCYMVLQEVRNRTWLDWITIKNTTSNWALNRAGLMKCIEYLYEERDRVVIPGLQKLEAQVFEEARFINRHPLFSQGVSSSPVMDKSKFEELLPFPDEYEELSVLWQNPLTISEMEEFGMDELISYVTELKADLDVYAEKAFGLKTLTWFTYSHSPEVAFKDIIGLYKEWCKYNSLFTPKVSSKKEKRLLMEASFKEEEQIKPLKDLTLDTREMDVVSLDLIIWDPAIILTVEQRWSLDRPTVEGEPRTEDIILIWPGEGKDAVAQSCFSRRLILLLVCIKRVFIEIWPLLIWTGILVNLSAVNVLPPSGVTVESEPRIIVNNWWKFIGLYILMWLILAIFGSAGVSDDPNLIPLLLPNLGNISDWEMEVLLNQERPLRYGVKAVQAVRSPELMHGWYEPYDEGFGIWNP